MSSISDNFSLLDPALTIRDDTVGSRQMTPPATSQTPGLLGASASISVLDTVPGSTRSGISFRRTDTGFTSKAKRTRSLGDLSSPLNSDQGRPRASTGMPPRDNSPAPTVDRLAQIVLEQTDRQNTFVDTYHRNMDQIQRAFRTRSEEQRAFAATVDSRLEAVLNTINSLAVQISNLTSHPAVPSPPTHPTVPVVGTAVDPVDPTPSLRPPSPTYTDVSQSDSHMLSKMDMEIFKSMLAKLPKLQGAGKVDAFLEFMSKVDNWLDFSKGKVSEGSLILHIKLNSEKAAEKFMDNLWATSQRPDS